jgi:hypothetical protein
MDNVVRVRDTLIVLGQSMPAVEVRDSGECREHRSPPLSAHRGRSVSVWVSDRLGPVAYPLAGIYPAIHRYLLSCHLLSQRLADVTEAGTAHFLVVRLQHVVTGPSRPTLSN